MAVPRPENPIQPLRVMADREAHQREAEAVGLDDLVEFQVVYTDEVLLHVAFAGPEDGEVVLMLHGFPDFWIGFAHQVRPLVEAGYRVIIPDQRGYNRSEKPRGVESYRLDRLGQDVIDLLGALNVERAHLVGHDWGGAVSWWLAEHSPQKWLSLSIMNCPPIDVLASALRTRLRQLRKSWYVLLFQLPRLPEKLIEKSEYRVLEGALKTGSMRGGFRREELQRYREAWARPGALEGMMNWYRASRGEALASWSGSKIEVPTQILWGKKDMALDPLLVEPSARRCRAVQITWFEEAGHWVQRDAADAVNAELLGYFQVHSD